MVMEQHSHRKFWAAIIILAVAAVTFVLASAWTFIELRNTKNLLVLVQGELTDVRQELAAKEAELGTRESQLAESAALVDSLQTALSKLQVNYQRLTTGYGYVLRDPSYEEMRDFLARDRTSDREYVASDYTCVDFAAAVKSNAAKEGVRCAYVVIEFGGGGGHAIVAFDTTDKGLIFVEPQFDWEVDLQVGKRYYQCVKPPPGHQMMKPPYDDTITRYIVVW